MKKTWNIEVHERKHTIEYKASFTAKAILDGEEIKLKSQNWCITLIDYKLPIEDAEVRIVVIGNKVNLVVNGVYLDSSDTYEPLEKVPGFVNVLIAISVIGGFYFFGILGGMIGMLFSGFYVKAALSGKKIKLVFTFIVCIILEFIVSLILSIIFALFTM